MQTNKLSELINKSVSRLLWGESHKNEQPRDRRGRWTTELEVIEWVPVKDNRRVYGEI